MTANQQPTPGKLGGALAHRVDFDIEGLALGLEQVRLRLLLLSDLAAGGGAGERVSINRQALDATVSGAADDCQLIVNALDQLAAQTLQDRQRIQHLETTVRVLSAPKVRKSTKASPR